MLFVDGSLGGALAIVVARTRAQSAWLLPTTPALLLLLLLLRLLVLLLVLLVLLCCWGLRALPRLPLTPTPSSAQCAQSGAMRRMTPSCAAASARCGCMQSAMGRST